MRMYSILIKEFIFIIQLSLLIFFCQMQKEKPQEKYKKTVDEVTYKLYKTDFQDLFIILKNAPKSLKSDLSAWCKRHDFRSYFVSNMSSWFKQNEDKLIQSAKKSHDIIDNLIQQVQIPLEVAIWYVEYLTYNRKSIEKQLDLKQADKLYKYVPIQLVVDYLALYKIQLTDKEKTDLVKEIASKASKISPKKIKMLPKILGDPKQYGSLLFQELFYQRRYDLLGDIFKTYKLSLEDYKKQQGALLESTAISMPRWKDSKSQGFTFDRVEEVFEGYPSAIGASIKVFFRNKKMSQKQKQIVASIVHRTPAIAKFLPNDIKNEIKSINKFVENEFRTNLFEPSNPNKYLTFKEFGIEQADVIMVTEANIQQAIKDVFSSDIIGIDTESTVARTSLNSNIDLLSIVQISTKNKVYIFDAKILIHKPYKSGEAAQFFKNPNKLIVGHTLGADLNQDVTRLFGYKDKVACKAVDICVVFKKCIPDRRPGLASIAETLLEKGICKEYTLTNWDRRPLLRNQIHYAAMDAFIVLKLWEILEQLEKKEDARRLKQKQQKEEKKAKEGQKVEQKKQAKQQHTDLQQFKLQQRRAQ